MDLFNIGAVLVGGYLLLGGGKNGGGIAGALAGGGATGAASFNLPAQPTLPGLPNTIILLPDNPVPPGSGGGGDTQTVVTVEDGNTPVMFQTPTFEVQGSSDLGFNLVGPPQAFNQLTGSTQIRIKGQLGQLSGQDFATTPDVLSAYLAGFDNINDWRAAQ